MRTVNNAIIMGFFTRQKCKNFSAKGFTLIELMVSVSIFVLVMTISMGAIVSILSANQKSQTLRSVVDNLDTTFEGMTRSIRFGTNYHSSSVGVLSQPRDTYSGDDTSSMTILDSNGNQITYALSGGQITRSINGSTPVPLTSPDVQVQLLAFRVYGSYPYPYKDNGYGSDSLQPFVIIVAKGTVTGRAQSSSTFTLETTVSQRMLDSQ